MRQTNQRPRAIFGAGVLSTALLAAGTAGAQAPAPASEPVTPPATSAAVPAPKAKAKLRVIKRRMNVRTGRRAFVRGILRPAGKGRVVRFERRVRGRWKTVDRDRTSRSGRFRVTHRSRVADSSQMRLRFRGDRATRSAKRRVGRVNIYRPALASWYGPGLYGNNLGCGGRLGTGTVGVAHKSLPCGTKLTLRVGKRIVRARVIDRGPYVGAREFDLTAATKQKLGFGSTGTVWVAH